MQPHSFTMRYNKMHNTIFHSRLLELRSLTCSLALSVQLNRYTVYNNTTISL